MNSIRKIALYILSICIVTACLPQTFIAAENIWDADDWQELTTELSSLSEAECMEYGISLDVYETYEMLRYKKYVSMLMLRDMDLLENDFAASFENAVNECIGTKTATHPYDCGALVNPDAETVMNMKNGVTFNANLNVWLNNKGFAWMEIPDAEAVLSLTLNAQVTPASTATTTRKIKLVGFSVDSVPEMVNKSGTHYAPGTPIGAAWMEYLENVNWLPENECVVMASDGTFAPNVVKLSKTVVNAVRAKQSTQLAIVIGNGGINAFLNISAATSATSEWPPTRPWVEYTYDKTFEFEKECVTYPENGSVNVADSNEIRFEWEDGIEEGTWKKENIEFINKYTGEPVEFDVRYDDENNTSIIPEETLGEVETYQIWTKNLKNKYSELMFDRIISFTTTGTYKSAFFSGATNLALGEKTPLNISLVASNGRRVTIDHTDPNLILTIDNTFGNCISVADGNIESTGYGFAFIKYEYYDMITGTELMGGAAINCYAKGNKNDFEADGDSTYALSGTKSYITENAEPEQLISTEYTEFLASGWFYDDMEEKAEAFLGLEGSEQKRIGFGENFYTINGEITSAYRSLGWHNAAFFVNGDSITVYIDSQKVAEYFGCEGYCRLIAAGNRNLWIDDVSIGYIQDYAPEITDIATTNTEGEFAYYRDVVSAEYVYYDYDNDAENGTSFSWYVADSSDGKFSKIAEGEKSLNLEGKYIGKYIKFCVTPTNSLSTGEEYSSDIFKVIMKEDLQTAIEKFNSANMIEKIDIAQEYGKVLGIDINGNYTYISDPSFVYGELEGKNYDNVYNLQNDFKTAVNKLYKQRTDKTAQYVRECTSVPSYNSIGAGDIGKITFTFNEKLDAATVNNASMNMVNVKTGETVTCTPALSGTKEITLKVTGSVEPETVYKVTFTGIQAENGNVYEERSYYYLTSGNYDAFDIYLNTSMKIGEECVPKAYAGEYYLKNAYTAETSDASVVSIENGTLKANKRGNAIITFTFTNFDKTQIKKAFNVTVYSDAVLKDCEEYDGEKAYMGNSSLKTTGQEVTAISFGQGYTAAECMFYDDLTDCGYIKAGDSITASADSGYYTLNGVLSAVNRTKGWHQFYISIADDKALVYIDGILADEISNASCAGLAVGGTGMFDNFVAYKVLGNTCYADNVSVRGSYKVNSTLEGIYGYFDDDNDTETTSEYKWYSSRTKDGAYTPISGAVSKIFTPNGVYSGQYIKFGVIPVNEYESGKEVLSDPVLIAASTVTGGGSGGGGGGSSSGGSGVTYTKSDSYVSPSEEAKPEDNIVSDGEFSDLSKSHWAYTDVMTLKENGIISGKTDTLFDPEGSITRAEFMKLIIGMIGEDIPEYAGIFEDVSENAWYAGYVEAAYKKGIISGYENKFSPEREITREEMAKIIITVYTMNNPMPESDNVDIKDMEKVSDWAAPYVRVAYAAGLLNGNDDGNFNPDKTTTRAQAAAVIRRLWQK